VGECWESALTFSTMKLIEIIFYKAFWEQLIAYFPSIGHGQHRKIIREETYKRAYEYRHTDSKMIS
jgi:hypothetical protein